MLSTQAEGKTPQLHPPRVYPACYPLYAATELTRERSRQRKTQSLEREGKTGSEQRVRPTRLYSYSLSIDNLLPPKPAHQSIKAVGGYASLPLPVSEIVISRPDLDLPSRLRSPSRDLKEPKQDHSSLEESSQGRDEASLDNRDCNLPVMYGPAQV